MGFRFVKHTRAYEISFLAINEDGRFCRVTIKYDYIDQIVGVFDKDMNSEDRMLYIDRMIAVGSEISKEEFEEIQQFYSSNTARMMFGELKKDELKALIQKHNVKEDKIEDVIDSYGRYGLDF